MVRPDNGRHDRHEGAESNANEPSELAAALSSGCVGCACQRRMAGIGFSFQPSKRLAAMPEGCIPPDSLDAPVVASPLIPSASPWRGSGPVKSPHNQNLTMAETTTGTFPPRRPPRGDGGGRRSLPTFQTRHAASTPQGFSVQGDAVWLTFSASADDKGRRSRAF